MNYSEINLFKGMYRTGSKSFTDILEELDPNYLYENTEFSDLDAFERQLKRFNIKIKGFDADVVEKFFSTSQSALLFPEYMARTIKKGFLTYNILDEISASKTRIDSIDYRPIVITDSSGTYPVLQAAELPTIDVRTKDVMLPLSKYARFLTASYETLKFQNLEVFNVILRKIGHDIAKEALTNATTALENNAKILDVIGAKGGLTYENFVKMWETLSPYNLNILMTNSKTIGEILLIPEFKNTVLMHNFLNTGQFITPLGAKIYTCETISDGIILAFDKNYTLSQIQYGGITVEYDKIINRQLDSASISITIGFNKFFDDAALKFIYV